MSDVQSYNINCIYKFNDYYASILLNYLRIWRLEKEQELTFTSSKPCARHFMYIISFTLVCTI